MITEQTHEEVFQHWLQLATAETFEEFNNEGIGASRCAYCRAVGHLQEGFPVKPRVVTCLGCPVRILTGARECIGTPFGLVEERRNIMVLEYPLTQKHFDQLIDASFEELFFIVGAIRHYDETVYRAPLRHPDPEIAREISADEIDAEAADLTAGYPPLWWECPVCRTPHGRGHFGAGVLGIHRCLRCGYVGDDGFIAMLLKDPDDAPGT